MGEAPPGTGTGRHGRPSMSPGAYFHTHPWAYRLALAGSVGTAAYAAGVVVGQREHRLPISPVGLAVLAAGQAVGIVLARRRAAGV